LLPHGRWRAGDERLFDCDADPCGSPSFCRVSRYADRRKARGEQPRYANVDWQLADVIPGWAMVSPERLWDEINQHACERYGTPQTTIEAILYSVRERGLAALTEPENVERFARCDVAAQKQIRERIARMKKRGKIGVGKPPIDEATRKLVAELSRDPEFQRVWQPAVRKFHGARDERRRNPRA
jgi:hypothetical protein